MVKNVSEQGVTWGDYLPTIRLLHTNWYFFLQSASSPTYNYTIRDLMGVDIRPAREFPVDPANTAGFDNSGETLMMSPTLLKKYLAAAREVDSHMYLKEEGFAFAPHPMLVETDRDKFVVHQIIDFYHKQNIDYADYFQTAWRFRHRAALGKPKATLADLARQDHVSAKYLGTVWSALESAEEAGPLVKLQAMWRALPEPRADQPNVARAGCEQMRSYIDRVRQKVEPRFINITAGPIGTAWQPLLIWKNTQYATHRRKFDSRQLQVEGEPPFNQKDGVEPEWDNAFRSRQDDPRRKWAPRRGSLRSGRSTHTLRSGVGTVFAASFPTCSTKNRTGETISARAGIKAAI